MFRKGKAGTVTVELDQVESALLSQLLGQMVSLLETPDVPEDPDPLARLVGLDGPTEAPRDPALARLFPSAYVDDEEASSEFRRFTEPDLRSRKMADARTVLDVVADLDGKVTLGTAQARAFLGALNDMRLTLGTRLGITDEQRDRSRALESHEADEGENAGLHVYDWLTYLQGTLIEAITGQRS